MFKFQIPGTKPSITSRSSFETIRSFLLGDDYPSLGMIDMPFFNLARHDSMPHIRTRDEGAGKGGFALVESQWVECTDSPIGGAVRVGGVWGTMGMGRRMFSWLRG